MRRITLPEVSFTRLAEDGQTLERVGAKEQLVIILTFPPPQKSLTLDDIRKRLPLCAKLEKSKRTLTLEDAEYAILQQAFDEAGWRSVNENIVILADAIENAETIDAADLEEPRPNRAERRRKDKKA